MTKISDENMRLAGSAMLNLKTSFSAGATIHEFCTAFDHNMIVISELLQAKDDERERAICGCPLSNSVIKTIENCLRLRKKELMSRKGHEGDKRIFQIDTAIRALKKGT